ncbi:MAG TPA: tetratricopeptide repeat protein [Thermoplasmata archaeon]|nr:tetratricopeptide repeat protein [Thermoplasmata archaeon]
MAGEKHRLAVLPLANISPDPGDEYFADGMTEELITALSKVNGLSVIARTSAMKYKGASKTAAEIGRELDVKTLLEGSVRKAGNKVRITLQLIDARSEEHLWAQAYDRDLEDIFAIQSDIAQRVARALRVQLVRREKQAIEQRATGIVEAYTLYLKGRHEWNKRSREGLDLAIQLFGQALAKDASYSLAHSGLADAYALQALFEFAPPNEAFPKARAAAERALQLDDRMAEAHTSLGLVRFQFEWDWTGAEAEFRRALDLAPGYPSAHQFYADFLKAMGRFDEAIAQMSNAKQLDPLSVSINTGLGHVLYLSRDYDRAIEQYRKALELDPGFVQAHLWFGRPYLQKGMFKEAIAEVQEAVRLSSGSTISLAVLGHVYAAAGDRAEAERILKTLMERAETQYLPSYWIALVYTGLADRERAFEWLERAYRERSSWLVWIGVEPRFDGLRSDPRFFGLIERMRLPGMSLGARAATVSTPEAEAAAFLRTLSAVKLGRYRVVGACYRYDAAARNLMKDLKQKIAAELGGSSSRNGNYLVWAPPGAGKTFFVQQVHASIGTPVRYVELNLAEGEERGFRSSLVKVANAPEPTLCLLDEIDSKPNESWPYEALLPFLEPGRPRDAVKVFVMAGSSGANLADLKAAIAARPKGADLLSRIPQDNLCSLPPMTVGDRLLVAVASFKVAAERLGRPISEIEKLALHYVVANPLLGSARQIREFTLRGVHRVPPGEDRVKYDHLFDPGDPVNKEFWNQARSKAPDLMGPFVQIEE